MTRETIEAAIDEWVREVAVDPALGVPDSAGGLKIDGYRTHLIGHMPTGEPPTSGVRSHHLDLRFLLTAEETPETIDPLLERLRVAADNDPELGGRLDDGTRLKVGEATVAKRGEPNPRGGPVVIVAVSARELDPGTQREQ